MGPRHKPDSIGLGPSVILLEMNTGAVVGNGCCRGISNDEQPQHQQLRCGWQVGDDFCSKTAPETSSTTRSHTDLPFGEAEMNGVSPPPVVMAKLMHMSVIECPGAIVAEQLPVGTRPTLETEC